MKSTGRIASRFTLGRTIPPKDNRMRYAVAYTAHGLVFVPALKIGNQVLWMRTDGCVAEVSCPVCEASVGELCGSKQGKPRSMTHYKRRQAAREKLESTKP